MDKSFSCGHEKDDTISRQAAIDRFQTLSYDDWNQGVSTSWANAYSECAEVIRDLPAVDTVPVVRCGECKHLMADGRCFAFADDNIRPSVSDFCSYGERREEDETGN